MKKSMIYTRTGDVGTTSLVGGVRVSKTNERLEAYGTIDELNSFLGMLVSLVNDEAEKLLLLLIQNRLFSVGTFLATDQSVTSQKKESLLADSDIKMLEDAIDRIDASLPPLKAFVLPGGCYAASICHVCRTVCRRAERRMLLLEELQICDIDTIYKSFMNRLSDYLFVLSRKLNQLSETDEIYWIKTCK